MRLLLDTHAFLFAISDPSRLSPAARQGLHDEEASKWVSAISLWEIIIKVQAGKLNLPLEQSYYLTNLRQLGAMLLPVDAQHSFELIHLPLLHKDPFDRLLIAQARVENMTLLTREQSIQQYPVKTLW